MKITVIQNRFGHLHIFKGNQKDKLTDLGSNILLNDKESELYMQVDTDINGLKEYMTKQQIKDLNAGYEVVIDDPGYFEATQATPQETINILKQVSRQLRGLS